MKIGYEDGIIKIDGEQMEYLYDREHGDFLTIETSIMDFIERNDLKVAITDFNLLRVDKEDIERIRRKVTKQIEVNRDMYSVPRKRRTIKQLLIMTLASYTIGKLVYKVQKGVS